MAQFDAREMFTRFIAAMNTRDLATLYELIQPDVVSTSPQSGERSQGIDAFLLEGDLYPGGLPEVDLPASKLVLDDDRWVITPSFTVVPLSSPNRFTAVIKVRYPGRVELARGTTRRAARPEGRQRRELLRAGDAGANPCRARRCEHRGSIGSSLPARLRGSKESAARQSTARRPTPAIACLPRTMQRSRRTSR